MQGSPRLPRPRWRRYFRLVRRSSIPGKTYAVGARRLIMPCRASLGNHVSRIALSLRAERSLSDGYPTSTLTQRTQLG